MAPLQVLCLLLNVGALVCSSLILGSAAAEFLPEIISPAPEPEFAADAPAPFASASSSSWNMQSGGSTAPGTAPSYPHQSIAATIYGAPRSPSTPEQSGSPFASPPSFHMNEDPRHAVPPANARNRQWRSPHHFTSAPVYSPVKNPDYKTAPAPMIGLSPLAPPALAPIDNSPAAAPSVAPVSGQAKKTFPAPFQRLPSPHQPSQRDCTPLVCSKPLTYSPDESPCDCVLPMQVAIRLSVASYVFLTMVPELLAEIAAGVFMKQAQVRITDANAAPDNSEKTIVHVDLLPIGEKIDDYTAYLIFERFWRKQVSIKASLFGGYDVLYVRYPGLPKSPPSPPSTLGFIASKPYPGYTDDTNMQPFGVDVRGQQHKHGFRGSILATIVISCCVALFLVAAVSWVLLFRYRSSTLQPCPTLPTTVHSMVKSSGAVLSIGSRPSSLSFSFGSSIAAQMGSARKFSSREIEQATDFFDAKRILGEGGFGRVYSGALEDGTKVAIKILKRFDRQSSREFLAEVEMLSRLHHRNLVKLIGICVEDRIHCLVYDLIPNGSLESHLHGTDKERSPLDWSVRLKIALGAARALTYLHEDSSPHVIHRDFKASNILLEDDFTPKVSDFGLARTALDEENRHISTRVMGTFGYVAPEYAMTGHLLVKSDVYSYGVVLLELLTGRTPVDMHRPSGEENLVSWARPLLTSREGLEAMVDQSLGPDFPFDSIAKVAAIASMCVQPEVSNRPFMGEVVQALKLVCNECDRMMQESSSGHGSNSYKPISDRMPATALSPSPVYGYDCVRELERDLTMSELLTSSYAQFGNDEEGDEQVRRYSSSGPLRMGKRKALWRTMREFKRSVSEHGVAFKLWPGSH